MRAKTRGGIKMRIGNIFLVLLLILSVLPSTIAIEEMESVCTEKISNNVGCVVPTGCTVTYDTQNQERIVKCPPYYRPKIDVVFVIDSTGSMADEIRTVKTHLIKIVKDVQGGQPSPYLRIGVVAYRDHELEEKEYLYRQFDLTSDINRALGFIEGIEARGGGDLPEAVADGLDVAINRMNWNNNVVQQNQIISNYPSTKKLIFLIGDAAPHGEGSTDQSYIQGSPDGHNYRQNIEDARAKGIAIYTVSGSGIDSVGIRIFQEIAYETGGSYTHLSYARQNVEEYYKEEGFAPAEVEEYAEEAKAYADYDSKSNSILTNTLGVFAKSTMKAEAQEMGVKYEDPTGDSEDPNDDWIDTDDITGGTSTDNKDISLRENLSDFFKKIFDKIAFWR